MRKLVTLVFVLLATQLNAGDSSVDLVDKMRAFQYFGSKLALSIDSKNQELADFYSHEMEEILEEVETIESFDGYPVGQLAKTMLAPRLDNLEKAIKGGDWKKADAGFNDVLNSCNSCHTTTEHGYISIVRSEQNPFMQTF